MWTCDDTDTFEERMREKRGRKRVHTSEERTELRRAHRRNQNAHTAAQRVEDIAVLDMETDPFDNQSKDRIHPFLAVLHSDQFESVVIWEEHHELFIEKVIAAIEALPRKFTIYAHNGGKFDYMFLISKIRGKVMFKGRGIMCAEIGNHEIRDSFHIIPERLANFKKDHIDYADMKKSRRAKHRKEIIRYCIADCVYLLDIVKSFVQQNGLKISIGQAALAALRDEYPETKARLGSASDEFFRHFFYGGRVECLDGLGKFRGHYKLYDVNSMYPAVMASCAHPVGVNYHVRQGEPNERTVFLRVKCRNRGALMQHDPDTGHTTATTKEGDFFTTIWEYNVAKKYNLISKVKILYCVDFEQRTTFERFVVPRYEARQRTKDLLKTLKDGTREHDEVKKEDIFVKLFLNNAYGKFAQNPRKYKETLIWDRGAEIPKDMGEWGHGPVHTTKTYDVWERPSSDRDRFNNVATAASITGAARAVLLEAIQNATDPIYCDTDSLICKDLRGVKIDGKELGAWDIEAEFDEVLIAGKKLYACRGLDGKIKIRSKGASGLEYAQVESLLYGAEIVTKQKGVTMTKDGKQFYMSRTIRATADRISPSFVRERRQHMEAA